MQTTKSNQTISFDKKISKDEIRKKTNNDGIMKYHLFVEKEDINRPSSFYYLIISHGHWGIDICDYPDYSTNMHIGGVIYYSFEDFVNIVYNYLNERQNLNLDPV